MLMAKSTKARCVRGETVGQSERFVETHQTFYANFLIPWSKWCSSRQYSRQIARFWIVKPSAFKKSRKVQKHRHFSRQKNTRQLSVGVFSYFSGQVTWCLLRHYHRRDRLPKSVQYDSNTIERSTMRQSSRNRIMWPEKYERTNCSESEWKNTITHHLEHKAKEIQAVHNGERPQFPNRGGMLHDRGRDFLYVFEMSCEPNHIHCDSVHEKIRQHEVIAISQRRIVRRERLVDCFELIFRSGSRMEDSRRTRGFRLFVVACAPSCAKSGELSCQKCL